MWIQAASGGAADRTNVHHLTMVTGHFFIVKRMAWTEG
jgi:hypothetical protein